MGELKGEIFRKAIQIALELLIEARCRNTIKLGQIAIEHDLFAANDIDAACDAFEGNNRLRLWFRHPQGIANRTEDVKRKQENMRVFRITNGDLKDPHPDRRLMSQFVISKTAAPTVVNEVPNRNLKGLR